MVTTFSARLLHLANKCTPIVGSKRKHIHPEEAQASKSDIKNHHTKNLSPETSATMKRSSDYYYAYTHLPTASNSNSSTTSDVQSNKRRRQKEELQYTASTIQAALTNAGRQPMSIMTRNRRERALPLGSVDMESAKVMTSAEFDELDGPNGDDGNKQENDAECLTEQAQEDSPSSNSTSKNINNSNGYGDLASMYMLSGLIQSTRNFYGFASSYDTTKESSPSSSMIDISNANCNSKTKTNISRRSIKESTTNLTQVNQVYSSSSNNNNCFNNNDEKQQLSEDNSEGLSSWTPSSSYNDLMTNEEKNLRMKNIDNDNQSDGQSSDMADSITSRSDASSSSPMQQQEGQQQIKDGEEGADGSDDRGVDIRRESYASIDDAPFSIVG